MIDYNEYTFYELMRRATNPHASKTIAPNTIIMTTCINAVRVVLHGNPIFDVIDGGYYDGVNMRILPDSFVWFTNTTQNRIGLVCGAYNYTVRRANKPERVYIIHDKRNLDANPARFDNNFYKFKPINHFIYNDSFPFPLSHNSDFRSFGSDFRGFHLYLDGDYSYYEQHG